MIISRQMGGGERHEPERYVRRKKSCVVGSSTGLWQLASRVHIDKARNNPTEKMKFRMESGRDGGKPLDPFTTKS